MNRLNRLLAITLGLLLAASATAQVTTSQRFGFRSANDPAYSGGVTCGTETTTGTSDHTALQAALNAANAAGGGTVYVPACPTGQWYWFSTGITVPSYVMLKCQPGAIFKSDTDAAPSLSYPVTGSTGFVGFYGVTSAGIDGCTIDSTSVVTASNQANLVEVRDSTPGTLGSGTRSSFIVVRNLTLKANSHANGPYITFVREANDVRILNNDIDGNQATNVSSDQQGIEIIAGNRVLVSGNRLKNIGRYGIYLGAYSTDTYTNYQSQDVTITNNQVNVAKSGIAFEAAIDGVGNLAYMEGVNVFGNTLRDAWEMGIRMGVGNPTALTTDTAVFRNVVVSSNLVDNSVLSSNPYGVGLIWGDTNVLADGVTFVGNTFKGGKGSGTTTPVGMRLDFVRGVTFEANVWSGGDTTTAAPLIFVTEQSHDLKFIGNTFGAVGGDSFGFGAAAADRFIFSGNLFTGYGANQAASNAIDTGSGTKNRWTVVGNTFNRSTAASEGYVMVGTIASNVGWVWRDNIVGHTTSLNYQAAGLWEGVCTTTFATVNANSHGCQQMATGTSSIQVANAQARSGSRVYVTQVTGDAIPVKVTAANGSFTIVAGYKDDGTTQFTCSASCDFRWELFN